jgi:hypothetical protein
MCPRAGLDGGRKFCPHQSLISKQFSPLANCYTDYTIPAHRCNKHAVNLKGMPNFCGNVRERLIRDLVTNKQKNIETNVIKLIWVCVCVCVCVETLFNCLSLLALVSEQYLTFYSLKEGRI